MTILRTLVVRRQRSRGGNWPELASMIRQRGGQMRRIWGLLMDRVLPHDITWRCYEDFGMSCRLMISHCTMG
jgi:hypothetical protein